MKISIPILVFICMVFSAQAQESNISIIGKIGSSSYNINIGSFEGSGGGDFFWKLGPMFSLGVEKRLIKNLSLQGTVEYTIHKYDKTYARGADVNDGFNSILDINARLKYLFHYLYFCGGGGVMVRHNNQIIAQTTNDYSQKGRIFVPQFSGTQFVGVFGGGLQFGIVENYSIFLETTIRAREYAGLGMQVGLKYDIQ